MLVLIQGIPDFVPFVVFTLFITLIDTKLTLHREQRYCIRQKHL